MNYHFGRIFFTGQAQPSDYLLLLYLLNIRAKEPKPPVEEGNQQGDKDGNSNPKDEDGNQPKDEDGTPQNKGQGEESNTKPKDGEGNAYEAEPLPDGNNVPEGIMKGRRPSSPEYSVLDANGNLTDYGKWYYERPSGFRDGVRNDTWNKAQTESIDGVVRDPVTGEPLNPSEPWDMGHDYGYEFRKQQQSAAERGIGRDQFLNEHNNYEHYRPEHPSSNRGHQGEAPDDVYYGP
ncbi:HNH/ENDO VII family nuclease [Chryseobacterium sp.]|uniref:HNH/ENDO VII family nuclease n=1 Tax=Chryseobacterium sp. TaxID=1871047 RepID=UPI00289A9528|nr:HNH/ENDO VII family nuclease [Chryseobacterium sp.]